MSNKPLKVVMADEITEQRSNHGFLVSTYLNDKTEGPAWRHYTDIPVLNIDPCRSALSDAGYAVPNLGVLADRLADLGNTVIRGDETLLMELGFGRDRRARRNVARIVRKHIKYVPMGYTEHDLLIRLRLALRDVRRAKVWKENLFDTHRVRIDLDEEAGEIIDRLRRITAITTGAGLDTDTWPWLAHDYEIGTFREEAANLWRVFKRFVRDWWDRRRDRDTTQRTGDTAVSTSFEDIVAAVRTDTEIRIAALETYRKEVIACERQWDRLQAAQLRDSTGDWAASLASSTSGDEFQLDHLDQLTDESRAATEALRELLDVMSGTVTELQAGVDR